MNTVISPETRENRFIHLAAMYGRVAFFRKILSWGGYADAGGDGLVMYYDVLPNGKI